MQNPSLYLPPNTPNLEEQTPSFVVRMIFEAAKTHLLPRFYQKALASAGLAQYIEDLPDMLSDEIVANGAQIDIFMTKVYEFSGDGIYPLFCQNVGRSLYEQLTVIEDWQRLKTRFERIFQDRQKSFEAKIDEYIAVLNYAPSLGVTRYYRQATVIYCEIPNCLFCRAIKTADNICFVRKTFYNYAGRWLSGIAYKVEQQKSVTRGDPACLLTFTPLNSV